MALVLDRFHDPDAFLASVEPFLSAREAEHNLLLGLLGAIRGGDPRYPDPYMAAVRDGDRVAAAALRTDERHQLILSEIDVADAVDLVAEDVRGVYPGLTGVLGERSAARRFVSVWERLTGRRGRLTMEQRIHRAERVRPPDPVSGCMRPGAVEEVDLLLAWFLAFYEESLEGEDPDPGDVRREIDRRLAAGGPSLVVWEDDGPVSMAGSGGPTPNGIRIGPVYTPPERRRCGYATALVAALTERLLGEDHRFCFLYTDLANPTSNAIYARVGYEPVCDVDQYRFEAPTA